MCHTLVEENQCPSTIAIIPPFQKHQQSGSQRGELHKRRSRGQQPCSDCPVIGRTPVRTLYRQNQSTNNPSAATQPSAADVIKQQLSRVAPGGGSSSQLISSDSKPFMPMGANQAEPTNSSEFINQVGSLTYSIYSITEKHLPRSMQIRKNWKD